MHARTDYSTLTDAREALGSETTRPRSMASEHLTCRSLALSRPSASRVSTAVDTAADASAVLARRWPLAIDQLDAEKLDRSTFSELGGRRREGFGAAEGAGRLDATGEEDKQEKRGVIGVREDAAAARPHNPRLRKMPCHDRAT